MPEYFSASITAFSFIILLYGCTKKHITIAEIITGITAISMSIPPDAHKKAPPTTSIRESKIIFIPVEDRTCLIVFTS